MNPESFTFIAPIEVPTICGSQRGFLHIVLADDGESYQLRWRSLEDWPLIVRESTGEEGRLVRRLRTDDLNEIPRHGRVTLTFDQCIAVDDGLTLYDHWDEEDWKVMPAVPAHASR